MTRSAPGRCASWSRTRAILLVPGEASLIAHSSNFCKFCSSKAKEASRPVEEFLRLATCTSPGKIRHPHAKIRERVARYFPRKPIIRPSL
jgi:hypothetical protein